MFCAKHDLISRLDLVVRRLCEDSMPMLDGWARVLVVTTVLEAKELMQDGDAPTRSQECPLS